MVRFGVIVGPLILVAHEQANGSTEGDVGLYTRLQGALIGFVALATLTQGEGREKTRGEPWERCG